MKIRSGRLKKTRCSAKPPDRILAGYRLRSLGKSLLITETGYICIEQILHSVSSAAMYRKKSSSGESKSSAMETISPLAPSNRRWLD